MFLRNVGIQLPYYTSQQPSRPRIVDSGSLRTNTVENIWT